ncbi:MAG: hypothetical protein JJLCMIEE_00901 [Acidimicrobiales bacterium]|nr:MAG: ABC transporter substrate-binding protein [Actinomycetota bacterium]MBV6507843.1 hypothetical protein [Acidimicrobiales bacterium]RIK05993.1 MAG: hypothetical protein DCC48_08550 [Acidobacteriota bacterium]
MRRLVLTMAAFALFSAACGSKVDEEVRGEAVERENANESQAGALDATAAAGEFPMVGTHELKCSPGDGDNTDPGIQGVTADTITIGVMADITGPKPGLGQPQWDAMDAFVALCNEHGGINGRQLELVKIDSALFDSAGAAAQACESVFVTVGDGVVFDNESAQVQLDCQQVSIPGWSANPEKSRAEYTYFPMPNTVTEWMYGGARYHAGTNPEAVKKAAIFYIPLGTTQLNHDQVVEANESAGFEYISDRAINVVETEWSSLIQEIRDKGAEYVYVVADVAATAQMLNAMAEEGWKPEIVDGGQQIYDPDLIEIAGDAAEGTFAVSTTFPFEEATEGNAIQVYLDYIAEVSEDAKPSALGVQAFSAGMLFAEAMHALGDEITMDGLAEALENITEWDGGGMHVPTNPGGFEGSECFMIMRVENGEFVRHFPATYDEGDVNGFSCSPENRYELQELEVAEGAKLPE